MLINMASTLQKSSHANKAKAWRERERHNDVACTISTSVSKGHGRVVCNCMQKRPSRSSSLRSCSILGRLGGGGTGLAETEQGYPKSHAYARRVGAGAT